MGQFLLNADGTIPNGFTADQLRVLGLTLILPTEPPEPIEGFVVIEGEPQDGRQTWVMVRAESEPTPDPEPESAPIPDLSPAQFAYLLAISGFEDLWNALEAKAKATDIEAYATLRGSRVRDVFRFDVTLDIIDRYRPMFPPGAALTAEELLPLWIKAAAF